ncbi:MAG: GTP-binding protein, partial [Candidatus Omnitrophota bacterium]
ISVADPQNLLKLIHTLPNIVKQIQVSDQVLLNKTDCYPPDVVQKAEEEIRKIQPLAQIARTQFCNVDVDPFAPGAIGAMTGEYALCVDPNYARAAVRREKPIDWARLKPTLDSMRDELYRVKGFIRYSEHSLYVDYSSAGWVEETLAEEHKTRLTELAIIVQGRAKAKIDAITAQIDGGEYDAL